tara:strand:+ start:694 stop:2700 length:2007 start_codon:yes stop_codon:yes gene_type:complete
MTDSPYEMHLSLNVLEHLGLNLYSNVPSVLSEVVANAWDADATSVGVTLDKTADRIIIEDNGVGMLRDHVNRRFLLVGYRRRDDQPGVTALGRHPMGRKGIGKLSLFSVANHIAVETARDGEKSALRMDLEDMREAIQGGAGVYQPTELPTDGIDFAHGTRITLSGLKKKQTISTTDGLRKRLARRFSIIGPAHNFVVSVNGDTVEPKDRGYYDKVQYLWTYGDQTEVEALFTSVEHEEARPNSLSDGGGDIVGWLGTVKESSQLKDDVGDNLNRIAIFVRGKMAQEDMLSDFTERGVYASYLIGEIRVDALDTDDGPGTDRDDDAATSSRQNIVEDDPRYIAVKHFLADELKHVQNRWSDLRSEAGVKKAMEIPAVKAWIENLPKGYKGKARKWLGKIHRISVDDVEERKQLIKHAVLAFEFYRWNASIDRLESISDVNIEAVIETFRELDSLEANLYGQIVQQRISVIRTLQDKVDANALEKVIQTYIFDHLWLLDPHWERAEASERMETRVDKLFEQVDATLTDEERQGRIDIGYRKTAGKHVIVELKRPERVVSVYELGAQIEKYRSGMHKILEELEKSHEPVEFVCLLGSPPKEWSNPDGKELVEDTLAAQNARYVNYSKLLEDAFQAYNDYLKRGKAIDRLGEVIKAIEDFGNEESDTTSSS